MLELTDNHFKRAIINIFLKNKRINKIREELGNFRKQICTMNKIEILKLKNILNKKFSRFVLEPIG